MSVNVKFESNSMQYFTGTVFVEMLLKTLLSSFWLLCVEDYAPSVNLS